MVFLILSSYIIGILIAGLGLLLFSDKIRFLRSYSVRYNLYRILKDNPDYDCLHSLRIHLIKMLENQFKISLLKRETNSSKDHQLVDEEKLYEYCDLLNSMINIYLVEKSVRLRPSCIFYLRGMMSRNLTIVLFIWSVSQLFIITGASLYTRIIILLIFSFINFLLLMYAKIQFTWMEEMRLKRFYTINTI